MAHISTVDYEIRGTEVWLYNSSVKSIVADVLMLPLGTYYQSDALRHAGYEAQEDYDNKKGALKLITPGTLLFDNIIVYEMGDRAGPASLAKAYDDMFNAVIIQGIAIAATPIIVEGLEGLLRVMPQGLEQLRLYSPDIMVYDEAIVRMDMIRNKLE